MLLCSVCPGIEGEEEDRAACQLGWMWVATDNLTGGQVVVPEGFVPEAPHLWDGQSIGTLAAALLHISPIALPGLEELGERIASSSSSFNSSSKRQSMASSFSSVFSFCPLPKGIIQRGGEFHDTSHPSSPSSCTGPEEQPRPSPREAQKDSDPLYSWPCLVLSALKPLTGTESSVHIDPYL